MKKSMIAMTILGILLLTGCGQQTTIILPPETTSAETTLMETAPGTSVPETQESTPATESSAATVPETSVSTAPATQPQSSEQPTSASKPTSPPKTSKPTDPPETSKPTSPPETSKPTDPPETSKPTTPPETSKPTETTSPSETTAPPETTVPVTTAPPETTEPDVYDISGHAIGSLEYSILSEINARRTEAGIPALTMDSKLCALSAIRAYECREAWGHTRPDGRSCFTVLSDYNYNIWSTMGENILYCSSGYSAADMVEAWMNSEGHRANILDADYTHTGIGVYRIDGLTYVANFFAG